MALERRMAVALWPLLLLLGSPRLLAQPAARLTVHADQAGPRISPSLYGIFFEEINRAGDGGIYGEMVQNRSFEDNPEEPIAWTLLTAGGEAAMTIDGSEPLNADNPHALMLRIAKVDAGGRVGVANEGFKGIAIQKGCSYALSLYGRGGGGFSGPLTVSLEREDSTVLASTKFDGIGAAWKRFDAMLTASETDPAARLVVATASPGTVWLDVVSLFPAKCWKGRSGYLRTDLGDLVGAMRPAFVRFPGGCYVEGDKLANAFRWKRTLGDIAQRPGHWNLWGYRSTDGLGFHEYLQLCEDLGASALFVVNCGMSHVEQRDPDKGRAMSEAEVSEYLQDALDAVEYANGPADSKWGSLRAKAGHPAPFNLRYIEIGNENGGPVYNDRYALFYDALKKKCPDVKLIANLWQGLPKSRPIEIIDEHYYSDPIFFMNNADRYDKYDRTGPRIYVGEYAVTRDCGKGNLKAAIGEAAFMTGMERNSDVVTMCSYAPLFVHEGWRQWNPDAIVFDSAHAFGTPSYHVQAMFAANRGDVVLPTEVESPQADAPTPGGTIGVGTWDTQAEFKDVKVTQGEKVLYQSDFNNDGGKGWKLRGEWIVQDGALRFNGNGTEARAVLAKANWRDCTISLKARKLGGSEGFLILFRAQNEKGKSWWNIGGWHNREHGLEFPGAAGPAADRVPGKIETGRWYDVRIELDGPSVRCYLDGKMIHDANAVSRFRSMYAVAGRVDSTGEVVLKVVNAMNQPQETQVDLQGVGSLSSSATVMVLTSADPGDENTFDAPTKVAPVTRTIEIAGPSFKHAFPANSVTVMRLKPTGAPR